MIAQRTPLENVLMLSEAACSKPFGEITPLLGVNEASFNEVSVEGISLSGSLKAVAILLIGSLDNW